MCWLQWLDFHRFLRLGLGIGLRLRLGIGIGVRIRVKVRVRDTAKVRVKGRVRVAVRVVQGWRGPDCHRSSRSPTRGLTLAHALPHQQSSRHTLSHATLRILLPSKLDLAC